MHKCIDREDLVLLDICIERVNHFVNIELKKHYINEGLRMIRGLHIKGDNSGDSFLMRTIKKAYNSFF